MSDPAMISAVQRLSSSGYFTLAAVHMSRPNATARAILIPVSWPTHLRFSPSLPPFLSPPVPACPPPRNQIGLRDSPADAPRRRNGHSGSGIVGRSGGRDADGKAGKAPETRLGPDRDARRTGPERLNTELGRRFSSKAL